MPGIPQGDGEFVLPRFAEADYVLDVLNRPFKIAQAGL